jgi:hypothetical protein
MDDGFNQISQNTFGWAFEKQNNKIRVIRGIRVLFPQIFADEPQISQNTFGWVIQKQNKKIRVIRGIRVPKNPRHPCSFPADFRR